MRKRWGWMYTLWKAKEFKVKILYFENNGSISNQRHKFRNELWLFIFGWGVFQMPKPERIKAGQCKFVPCGYWHMFQAKAPTLVLEIQTGKCSERDIERAV